MTVYCGRSYGIERGLSTWKVKSPSPALAPLLQLSGPLWHTGRVATIRVGPLGEYIREQRRSAQYSLRQLAEVAGVSNPYLSQIERGLRKPSAEILQQIAKALRISAETLYVQAGILDEPDGDRTVIDAISSDTAITERQKRVLLDIYDAFRKENADASASASKEQTRLPSR